MNKFEVLSRNQEIGKSYFIEASAGTGKTFAIENIVVRLILEVGFELDKILLVTFTKKATNELRWRIKNNLQNALSMLEERIALMPDYLNAIIENGEDKAAQAILQLKSALINFDQSKIFTIHSFCYHCLKNHPFESDTLPEISLENPSFKRKVLAGLRDFMSYGLTQETICAWQLDKVVHYFGSDINDFLEEIYKMLSFRKPINVGKSYKEIEQEILLFRTFLNNTYALNREDLIEDFMLLAPCFGKMSTNKRELKEEIAEEITFLCSWLCSNESVNALFDHSVSLMRNLSEKNLLKRAQLPKKLHHENLYLNLLPLIKLIEEASDVQKILALLTEASRVFIEKLIEEEEVFHFDDLLIQMKKNLKKSDFVASIQESFQTAIIDEFQDTDAIQWEIFSSLFHSKSNFKGYLYLIGDPKQSIYSFRNADVYTYLKAKKEFSSQQIATLEVNFRSVPQIICGLNFLFEKLDGFGLPKINSSIAYNAVKCAKDELQSCSNEQKAIEFFIHSDTKSGKSWPTDAAEAAFYPLIGKAIASMNKENGIPLSQCAILVKDRHQAKRIGNYLKKVGFPVNSQKKESLLQSPAIEFFKELLEAILNPQESLVNTVLLGKIVGYSASELKSYENDIPLKIAIMEHLKELKIAAQEKGIPDVVQKLFLFHWGRDMSCCQALLKRGEEQLYRDLFLLSELICEESMQNPLKRPSLEEYLAILKNLKNQDPEDERFKINDNKEEDAIPILTIHVSKGLEFEAVFPLGLINRFQPISFSYDSELKKMNFSAHEKDFLEQDAEKMRLLYVALTRAKSRLFIPVLFEEEKKDKDIAQGSSSCMELFLQKILPSPTIDNFIKLIEMQKSFSYSLCTPVTYFWEKNNTTTQMLAPDALHIDFKDCYVESFSSLKKQNTTVTAFLYDEIVPVGAEFGIKVHSIMEKISFSIVKQLENSDQLSSFIHEDPLILDMIFHALKVPLKLDDQFISLCDIDPKKMIKELPFTMKTKEGFLKGFIDLFFEFKGKYYLIDWKTNYLGPSKDDYIQANLEEVIQSNDYTLQVQIYTSALQRYLSLFDQRPFSEIFGGAFILFLRGLDCHSTSNNGIYLFQNSQMK